MRAYFLCPFLVYQGGEIMKFKALTSFASSLGAFDADEQYDVKLDKPTAKMWVEHGLIEEVKGTQDVTVDENK